MWNMEANYTEIEEKEDLLLMAYAEQDGAVISNTWFIDSGCSNHMRGDSRMFFSIDTFFSHSLMLGNNTRMKVVGKGMMKLVLHTCQSLKKSSQCVGQLQQLQEKGIYVVFQDGVCNLYHP